MELLIKSEKHGNHLVFFDEEDAHLIIGRNWFIKRCANKLYARANNYQYDPLLGKNKESEVVMHRLIMGFPSTDVDHKDCNGLNNRRNNLRLCSHGQNMANRICLQKNSTSGYKGVWKVRNRWRVLLRTKGKRYHGGYFDNIHDAAKKYNELAIAHFGEFANLNTIQE